MTLKKKDLGRMVHGTCPVCNKDVYEHLVILDDAFACTFTCPHCQSRLVISGPGLRGYDNKTMGLIKFEDALAMEE